MRRTILLFQFGFFSCLFLFAQESDNVKYYPTTKMAFQVDTSFPTADKPQSKLWFMNGSWWALLPRSTGPSLWQRTEEGWREDTLVTEALKGKPGRADVWADDKWATAVGVGKNSLTVFRLIAEDDSPETQWKVRVLAELLPPSSINPIETATITQDDIGDWWVAAVVDTKVCVWNSSAGGRKWTNPIVLAEGMDEDDICVITQLPDAIGVIWSDQVRDAILIREHRNINSHEKWEKEIIIDSGNNTADDHLNTSLSSNGTLWVTSKNSLDKVKKPQFVLRVRTADGVWTNKPYLNLESKMKRPSRPIVIATENNSIVFVGHGDNDRSIPSPHDAKIVFSVVDTLLKRVVSKPKAVIFPDKSYKSFVHNVTGPRHPFPMNVPWIILASDNMGRVYEADLRQLTASAKKK